MSDEQTTPCPTCGQPLLGGSIATGRQLAAAMRSGSADVYLDYKGIYRMSRGLGRVQRCSIEEAIRDGLIVEKYPDRHHKYWMLADAKAT